MPAALTTPIAKAVRRVTSAMQGDAQARLDEAMGEVTRLQESLASIEREIVARKFETLRKCAGNSPPMSLHASLISADPAEAFKEFGRKNPSWPSVVRQACELRLAIAQADYDAALKRTRKELAGEGFSEAEIMDHPRARRARRALNLWRGLVQACDSETDADLWKKITTHLL